MVTDLEVAEEDGAWQSNAAETQDANEGQQCPLSDGGQALDTRPQPQQMIDLLEGIGDEMQIDLKTEPLSPALIDCGDIEACLQMAQDSAAGTASSQQQPADSRYPLRKETRRTSVDQTKSDRVETKCAIGGSGTYCGICNKSFSRAWSLQRHMADTHFYVPQSLQCELCGRSYKSRNSLVSHKSQYHGRKEGRREHQDSERAEISHQQ